MSKICRIEQFTYVVAHQKVNADLFVLFMAVKFDYWMKIFMEKESAGVEFSVWTKSWSMTNQIQSNVFTTATLGT